MKSINAQKLMHFWPLPALFFLFIILIPYGETSLIVTLLFSIGCLWIIIHKKLELTKVHAEWLLVCSAITIPVALSLVTAHYFERTLVVFVSFTLQGLAGLYIITLAGNKFHPHHVIYGIGAIVLWWSIDGLRFLSVGIDQMGWQILLEDLIGRAANNRNLGILLAHLSPFFFEAIYRFSVKRDSHWPWLLTSPIFLAILFSGNRSAWLILSIVCAFFLVRLIVIKHFNMRALVIIALCSITFLVIAANVSPNFQHRMQQTLLIFDGSTDAINRAGSGRLELWRGAVELSKDIPLSGIGRKALGEAAYDRGYTQRDFGHAHLYWLEVLIATGFIGLIAYVAVFSYLVWLLLKTPLTHMSWAPMLAAICAALPINTHYEFYGSRPASVMWFLLFIAFAFRSHEKSNVATAQRENA